MPVTQTIDEIYPNRWLKADDIPEDGDLVLTVTDANIEQLGENKESRLVLVFHETTKSLAVNKTNAKVLEDLYGKNPNDWIGKRIGLYASEVQFAGKTTLGIRVRLRPPAEQRPRREPEENVSEYPY